MYHNYSSGDAYNCGFSGPFAVVGFRSLESSSAIDRAKLPKAKCGSPNPCTGGLYPGHGPVITIRPGPPVVTGYSCRDWSGEFDYSVMLVQ
jgi:hypothetical protein